MCLCEIWSGLSLNIYPEKCHSRNAADSNCDVKFYFKQLTISTVKYTGVIGLDNSGKEVQAHWQKEKKKRMGVIQGEIPKLRQWDKTEDVDGKLET